MEISGVRFRLLQIVIKTLPYPLIRPSATFSPGEKVKVYPFSIREKVPDRADEGCF
jgi:hypothetical protein